MSEKFVHSRKMNACINARYIEAVYMWSDNVDEELSWTVCAKLNSERFEGPIVLCSVLTKKQAETRMFEIVEELSKP